MFRRHLILKTVAAGLALAAASSPLRAQDAAANVEVRRISNILKTKVVIQENQPAGEIVDVVYNDGGCIDYYVASYDNRQYVVPFDVVQYRSADRVVFIDVGPAQFRQVEFFAPNQFPNVYAPAFRNSVYASFNVRGGANARSRTTLRQGTDVDVNVRDRDRDRTDVNTRDRDANMRDRDRNADPANRDRDTNADRDRPNREPNADRPNRPETGDHPEAGDRPKADRPEREPAPGAGSDRSGADKTPPPPRPGTGNNPGREGASPPRAGSDTNPGRGSNPPANVNPGSASGSKPAPKPDSNEKKPLTPPPTVPK